MTTFKEGDNVILVDKVWADNGQIFTAGQGGWIVDVLKPGIRYVVEFAAHDHPDYPGIPNFTHAEVNDIDLVCGD